MRVSAAAAVSPATLVPQPTPLSLQLIGFARKPLKIDSRD